MPIVVVPTDPKDEDDFRNRDPLFCSVVEAFCQEHKHSHVHGSSFAGMCCIQVRVPQMDIIVTSAEGRGRVLIAADKEKYAGFDVSSPGELRAILDEKGAEAIRTGIVPDQ